MSVVRGGRGTQTLAAQEAVLRQQQQQAEERLLNDVRVLLRYPEFIRYVRHWIAASDCFTVAEIFSAEVYARNARAALGMAMWNQIVAADKSKVVELLDLTTDESPAQDPHV